MYLAPEIEIANLAVKKAEAEERIAAQRIKNEEIANLLANKAEIEENLTQSMKVLREKQLQELNN